MNLDQRNTELDEKLKDSDLPKAVSILVKDARKRKRQLFILTLSVILDILLSVGLFLGYKQNHKIATQAETNHNALVRSCEVSNEARAKNRAIWDYVINLSAQAPQTPEAKAKLDAFVVKLNDTFAPRDCSKL